MAWNPPRTDRRRDVVGLVWQRRDFRESSRLITFLTPARGRLTTLGKGAHRPGSQCLGRIDFLNLVEIKFSRGTLPILHRVKLLHEHRRLREPARFLGASYLAELFDSVFLVGRPEPELFDLLTGGLRLLERCPTPAIQQILLGLESRFLREQGLQPSLDACTRCGTALADGGLFVSRGQLGLACQAHADGSSTAVSAAAIRWLRHIQTSPGRAWPALAAAPSDVVPLLGRWIHHALERRPRTRRAAMLAN